MRLEKWTGVDTLNETHSIGLKGLQMAVNVDATDTLTYRRRPGRTCIHSEPMRAGWSDGTRMFAVSSAGVLYRIESGGSEPDALTGGVVAGNTLSGAHVNGITYLSTGVEILAVEGRTVRPIGVPQPYSLVINTGDGQLLPGLYFIAATTVLNGRESGATTVRRVRLDQPGSIIVSAVAAVGQTRIYVSGPNARVMFYRGADVVELRQPGDVQRTTYPLTRRFGGPIPAGSILSAHHGRLLSAEGSTLWYSEPFDFEFCKYSRNAVQFDGTITLCMPVDAGTFVGDSVGVHFLSGDVAAPDNLRTVYPHPAIAGTGAWTSMNAIGDGELSARAVLFCTRMGLCLGLPDGSVQALTERRLRMPQPARATAYVRRGSRYVVSMQ